MVYELRHRFPFVALAVLFSLALVPAWTGAQRNDNATERDRWQRPAEVMDVLGIQAGSAVADVGCGEGYFVLHLARRVGPAGLVYGVDLDKVTLEKVRQRVQSENLGQVRIVVGKKDDPLLPPAAPDAGLDAVLIVNAYHEMREQDAMLRAIFAALKPGGRLAIIDAPGKEGADRATHRMDHTISEGLVGEDAARNGFRLRSREPGFDRPNSSRGHWFFLIFEKPES